jgi:hypothetical protein
MSRSIIYASKIVQRSTIVKIPHLTKRPSDAYLDGNDQRDVLSGAEAVD